MYIRNLVLLGRTGFGVVVGVMLLCAVMAARTQAGQTQAQPAQAAQDAVTAFHEEVIADVTQGSEFKDALFGVQHIAWVEEHLGKRTVMLDGKQQGGLFEDAKWLTFSPDEAHFVFFGKRASAWIFVLDGEEHPQHYTKSSQPSFQPMGKSYAYCACQDKKCRLVVDGAETGAEYEDFSYPQYSLDGKRLAFLAKRGKKWIAVVDGKEMPPELDEISNSWGFTADGGRFFTAGRIKGGLTYSKAIWTYAVDGAPGPAFEVISPIAFSSDGKHYAYGGTVSKSAFTKEKTIGTIVLDGQAISTHEGRGMSGGFLNDFSGTGSESLVRGVRDLHPDFHGISTPSFNQAGKLVYAARREKGDVAMFVGDEAGPGFDEILTPVVFSPDSEHSAYVAKTGNDFVAVVDNHPGSTFTPSKHGATAVQWIAFSMDSKHLAFVTVGGGVLFKSGGMRALRSLVLDGKAGPEYNALNILVNWGDLGVDKDAQHYFYEVSGAKGTDDLMNVDGHESRLYNAAANPHFSEDGKNVVFVARDGGRFLRVTYALESGRSQRATGETTSR